MYFLCRQKDMIRGDGSELGNIVGMSTEKLEARVGDQEQVQGLKTIVESQGWVAGLEDELQWPEVVPGEHKVFNWTDTESTSSIWLMKNLSQRRKTQSLGHEEEMGSV